MDTNQLNEYKESLRAKGFSKEEVETAVHSLWYDEGIRVFPTHTERNNGDGCIEIRIPRRS